MTTGSRTKKGGVVMGAIQPLSLSTSNSSISPSASSNEAFLLARGWTARISLPANLPPLRAEEMDKDLRHMQVYSNAVQAYQQQLYIQTNSRGNSNGNNGETTTTTPNNNSNNGLVSSSSTPGAHNSNVTGSASSSMVVTSLSLPVRIDPEEEKRLWNLQKKIAAAEVLREQLEQEWVANQAHYVHMAARLRQAEKREMVEFLRIAVKAKANVLAHARVRLQMTRDILAVLLYRNDVLRRGVESNQPTNNLTMMANNTTQPPMDNPNTAHSTQDVLTDLWMAAEDEYKRACLALAGLADKDNKGSGKKKNLQQAVWTWPCTKLTSTPTDVPLFLSNLSNIPDKTLAYGADHNNMIWLPLYLNKHAEVGNNMTSTNTTPDHENMDEEHDDVPEDIEVLDEKMIHENYYDISDEALHSRVLELEQELARERTLNTEWCSKIATCRLQHNEWVAMMSVVRQETEAVLHRHNILLESDPALAASEQWHAQELAKERAAKLQAETDSSKTNTNISTNTSTLPLDDNPKKNDLPEDAATAAIQEEKQPQQPPTAMAADEAANYGDDEGSGGDPEEEQQEWTDAGKKRSEPPDHNNNPEEEEEEDSKDETNAKRRKVAE